VWYLLHIERVPTISAVVSDEVMIRCLRIELASDTNDKHDWRITCAAQFGQGCTRSDERRETLHRWHTKSIAHPRL
jgi:hypothetical protein